MTEITPEGFKRFFERSADQRAGVVADEEEHEYDLEVIEASRPATVEDLNGSVAGIIAWLALCGFWSASQVTRVFQPGTLIKSGQKEGEMRPDKTMTNFFIHAAHPDRRVASIWYVDGSLRSANLGLAHQPQRLVKLKSELEDFIKGGAE